MRIHTGGTPDSRYGAPPLLLLLVPPAFAGFVGIGWELSQWAGLAGAIACIRARGRPVAARELAPPTLLTLRLHTLIGWAALAAVACTSAAACSPTAPSSST